MLKQKSRLLLAAMLLTGISFVACNDGEKKADEATPAADSPKMEAPKVDTPAKAMTTDSPDSLHDEKMDKADPKPLKPGT